MSASKKDTDRSDIQSRQRSITSPDRSDIHNRQRRIAFCAHKQGQIEQVRKL